MTARFSFESARVSNKKRAVIDVIDRAYSETVNSKMRFEARGLSMEEP
jgi:hypothetical protein